MLADKYLPLSRIVPLWSQSGGVSGPAVLEVRESNAAAIRVYKRHGFEEVGRRKKFYPDGEGAVLMNRAPGRPPAGLCGREEAASVSAVE